MIPRLTCDSEAIRKNWKDSSEEDWKMIEGYTKGCVLDGSDIEVYLYDESWVRCGIFKEFKKVKESLVFYGYCSTEKALAKFLQQYVEDKEKNYYVHCHLLDMDYEKYYKFGSYINNDGVDTEDDYDWDNEEEQQYEDKWIAFSISEIGE